MKLIFSNMADRRATNYDSERYKFLGDYLEPAIRAADSLGLSLSTYIKWCVYKGLENHLEMLKELAYQALSDHINRSIKSRLIHEKKKSELRLLQRMKQRKYQNEIVTYPSPKPIRLAEIQELISTRKNLAKKRRISNFGPVKGRANKRWLVTLSRLLLDEKQGAHEEAQRRLESEIVNFSQSEITNTKRIKQTLDIQRRCLREHSWDIPILNARKASKKYIQLKSGEQKRELQTSMLFAKFSVNSHF